MPSGSSMRPGDIITHYGGQTSEVDNTDAEGRLILADALGYALTFKPSVVIDLATLTGACVVALGSHAAGMMGTDDATMAALRTAGDAVFERVWPLPLFEEYEKQIRSDVADVKNVGGRWGGAITAGLFLKKFVKDYPWVHLDIAGTAILEEDFPYAPRGGSGYGVRLLVEYLRRRS
jgi:leucyl aminopeptidase